MTNTMLNKSDWIEYKRLIMDKLEYLEKGQKEHTEALAEIKTEIATLKTKASMWGGIAGAIITSVGFIINYLR